MQHWAGSLAVQARSHEAELARKHAGHLRGEATLGQDVRHLENQLRFATGGRADDSVIVRNTY